MAFWSRSSNHYLLPQERDTILDAIKKAESNTSGEIRVFIESRCPMMDTLTRAEEVFLKLKMQNTTHHNASLIYIAYKDREFAIYGDAGCIQYFPSTFWKQEARRISYHFAQDKKLEGIMDAVQNLEKMYIEYFPSKGEPKNELPDEIVFGK
jgi:uncharacterized membrane protein